MHDCTTFLTWTEFIKNINDTNICANFEKIVPYQLSSLINLFTYHVS